MSVVDLMPETVCLLYVAALVASVIKSRLARKKGMYDLQALKMRDRKMEEEESYYFLCRESRAHAAVRKISDYQAREKAKMEV